jgi:hypothetical protein
MLTRMRRGAPRYATARRVGARSLHQAFVRGRHEVAHLIIPLLSIAAATLIAILVPRETLGDVELTVVAIAAGFLLWVAVTALLSLRRIRREMISEFIAEHGPQTETSMALDLYVKDTVAAQEISCVVIEPGDHEVMSMPRLGPSALVSRFEEGRYLDYLLNYPSGFDQRAEPVNGETYDVVWWARLREGEGWIEVATDSFEWGQS